MGTELATSDALKKMKMSGAFAAIGAQENTLSDGISQAYGIIHYKGKVWTLRIGGQDHIFTRPDDGTPSNYIDVIILKSSKGKSKSYYEGFDQDAAGKRPVCSALDGQKPDADAQKPQSTACAICPRDAWKTDAQGKKHKECSDYKRVAVLLLPTTTQRMLGTPLLEPVFLRVPAASLLDLATYGKNLEATGMHQFALVTRVQFDPTKAHPQMQFRPLQELTDAEAPVIIPLLDDPITKRIVGEQGVMQQIAAPPQQFAIPQQASVDTGFAPRPASSPTVIELKPETPPWTENAKSNPLTATVKPKEDPADVGAPTPSDAALDAKLSAMLPSLGL